MKKMIVAICLFICISVPAYADRVNTQYFKIQSIGADGNGPVIIQAPSGVLEGCPGNRLQFWIGVSDVNEQGYMTITSMAMAAYMSDKEIMIEYNNSTPSCYAYKLRMK